MTSKKVQIMVTAAFFVALDIIAARYLGFEFPTPIGPIKFDFQIIVAALCGYALGPFWACLTLVSSDLLGAMLNSGSLGIFLGFTLSAALRGFGFGLLLHNKHITPLRIIICVMTVFIPIDLCLNTLWLSIIINAPYFPLLISRIIPKLILMGAEIVLTIALIKMFYIIKKPKST